MSFVEAVVGQMSFKSLEIGGSFVLGFLGLDAQNIVFML
jgi:hypothetical protein